MSGNPSVAIIGGGLAGLAATALLCEREFEIELFEAKRFLGGRAGSFVDPESGELVDHCQHVAMGCCTAFLDFCQRTGVEHLFRRHHVLHFFSPEGKRHEFAASRWLPAPLHLTSAMARLSYLSWSEKLGIARALRSLCREAATPSVEGDVREDINTWLQRRGQSQQVIDRFWSVVLVSALGEKLENASVAAARKVFLDGFLSHRNAYEVIVPQAPLGEIYERGIASWLRERGVVIHVATPIEKIQVVENKVPNLTYGDSIRAFDYYVVATDWQALPRLLDSEVTQPLDIPWSRFTGSPITSIHLWFDRPIMQLPHAVLVDRFTQWIFKVHPAVDASAIQQPHAQEFYYQAVVSASSVLRQQSREATIARVLADLRTVFPDASLANLLRFRILTQPNAVFSYTPKLDNVRPRQQSPIRNLLLAGDWTSTGWPSTMESAVRSGYLAAGEIFRKEGCDDVAWPESLPRSWLVRTLLGVDH